MSEIIFYILYQNAKCSTKWKGKPEAKICRYPSFCLKSYSFPFLLRFFTNRIWQRIQLNWRIRFLHSSRYCECHLSVIERIRSSSKITNLGVKWEPCKIHGAEYFHMCGVTIKNLLFLVYPNT